VRVSEDEVPRLPIFPAQWALDDPRQRAYLVIWGNAVRAVKIAPTDGGNAVLVTLTSGETYKIAMLRRRLPRGSGTTLFYLCPWCRKPRRFLYLRTLSGKGLVGYLGPRYRECAGLRFASRGRCGTKLAREFRPILGPRPRHPWGPWAVSDPRMAERRSKTGSQAVRAWKSPMIQKIPTTSISMMTTRRLPSTRDVLVPGRSKDGEKARIGHRDGDGAVDMPITNAVRIWAMRREAERDLAARLTREKNPAAHQALDETATVAAPKVRRQDREARRGLAQPVLGDRERDSDLDSPASGDRMSARDRLRAAGLDRPTTRSITGRKGHGTDRRLEHVPEAQEGVAGDHVIAAVTAAFGPPKKPKAEAALVDELPPSSCDDCPAGSRSRRWISV
jgi:hypothetical protein